MTNLERAVQLKAELDALRPISAEQEARIWQKFRFDWNYHSNNIEGNSLTFGETKSLLLHNITAQGKPLKDHIEVTGHNEAINALLDLTRGEESLSESFFRSLHTLILRERYQVDAITLDGKPTKKWIEVGQYKSAPNHVITATGETFRFAEPIDVPEKMRALIAEVNALKSGSDIAAIIAAAKIHYDFVLIHPFDDGNGRMARLLMNLILIKFGFPPAIIRTEDKANYFSALRQADGGQLDVFVEYIAGCVCASLTTMLAGARGESIEEADEQDRQIKMLAKLLESKVGELSATRSKESVKRLCALNFDPLANLLFDAAKKFATIYLAVESKAYIKGGTGLITSSGGFDSIESLANESTTSISFVTQFSHLKFRGFDQHSFEWSVQFTLNPGGYEIVDSVDGTSNTRTYDRLLTEDELIAIKTKLVKQQIRLIEAVTGTSLEGLR